ncbi:TIGR01777 family oxidoreductase [Sediminibacterium soli]|uniref:TIGR01777 family oxidoreductase n=1 Tax=Sediminibacterium soli TaxID=2698829 RepID=UPI00137A064A|nr:TIGR01777 family oxidoreductase [Sediminibacterium soli]NCI48022.1 TIGR01777 family protein [Sediminibacterium soli]
MATVLITGGTGMIGTRLSEMLTGKGHQVIILTRQAKGKKPLPRLRYAQWDTGKEAIDSDAIAASDHIIHLAGEGVADKRWSEKRKQQLLESRTRTSSLLVKALEEIPNRVRSVISASAIGWYGADTAGSRKKGFDENAAADGHFLGETCRLWEASIQPVQRLGKRLVILRTGIVLSPGGGALQEFKKPVRAGIAAILGDGKQVVSWIHVDDLCRMYIAAIENESMHGPYNAVAPHPVTNKALTLALAELMRGKYFIPLHIPVFALKLIMGEMSIEVLKSATVNADKIQSTGFSFLHRNIREALQACV